MTNQLFDAALGIKAPWYVQGADFDTAKRQLTIAVDFVAGSLVVLAKFQGHQWFDGVMLGRSGMDYHFEFTQCREHPVAPTSTREDLLVFYAPDLVEWQSTCDRLAESGFVCVTSLNPYWDVSGRTFEDHDGYRIVLQNSA